MELEDDAAFAEALDLDDARLASLFGIPTRSGVKSAVQASLRGPASLSTWPASKRLSTLRQRPWTD